MVAGLLQRKNCAWLHVRLADGGKKSFCFGTRRRDSQKSCEHQSRPGTAMTVAERWMPLDILGHFSFPNARFKKKKRQGTAANKRQV
jgi:hypothetical protein